MDNLTGSRNLVLFSAILCLLSLTTLALAPTPPPAGTPIPTPAVVQPAEPLTLLVEVCKKSPGLPCLIQIWETFHWWGIIIIILIGLGFLGSYFLKSAVEEFAKNFISSLKGRQAARGNSEQAYLKWFITQYENPKFGPRSLAGQFSDKQAAKLEDIYLPVDVVFEAKAEAIQSSVKHSQKIESVSTKTGFSSGETRKSRNFLTALQDEHRLSIIGPPGSGKSTLLQWAGLACAHSLLGQKFKGQDELVKILNKALFPIFVSLGAFDRFCLQENRVSCAAALLDFIAERYKELTNLKHGNPSVSSLTTEFFEKKIKNGCLLLLDGLDEVDPIRRPAVRLAVEDILKNYAGPQTRALITARPSAQGDAQPGGSCLGHVLPLDEQRRDVLIHNLYLYYEPKDAGPRSAELIQRIEASDTRVQQLAETPLLTTIFVLIHRPGHELPHQRAEVYDNALDVLVQEIYHQEGATVKLSLGSEDAFLQRSRLALIAFQLHLAGRGDEGLAENDLIEELRSDFPGGSTDADRLKTEIHDFLYAVSFRGGLLQELDCTFSFGSHRSFQEFLAGWYLVKGARFRTLGLQAKFIQEHLLDENWEEPVRLAAGFLAVGGSNEPNDFIKMLARLGKNQKQRDQACALAGLCLVDLPITRVERPLREELSPKMVAVLQRNPPLLSIKTRFDLGLALGALRAPDQEAGLFDTRLQTAGLPEMVLIPAGRFSMGSSEQDAEALKKQETTIFDDEKPAHQVEINYDYRIGKYPLTNAEFTLFVKDNGYDLEQNGRFWSEDGRRWRTGPWQDDLSIYLEENQKAVQDWLAKRPFEKRNEPFYWHEPMLNGPNQPVVGVSWFEAEAYCAWLNERTGFSFRLATEAEWEKAARCAPAAPQTDKIEYYWPWGDKWDLKKCNSSEGSLGRTSPVGIFTDGASQLGCMDMVGNVWEWCLDWYEEDEYEHRRVNGQAVINPQGPLSGKARVVRGGSWSDDLSRAPCADRNWDEPGNYNYDCGFRLVLPSISHLKS